MMRATVLVLIFVGLAASTSLDQPNIVKNKIISSHKNFGPYWEISFLVKPIMIIKNVHTSVVHVSSQKGRTRFPGVWFNPGALTLHICANVDGSVNNCYNTVALVPCLFHQITIKQFHHSYKRTEYEIFVDGKSVKAIHNKKVVEPGDVHLYSGDPWFEPAYAHVKDIVYKKLGPGYPLVKNVHIETKKELAKAFHLSFYIKANGIIKKWGSILHATIGGNIDKFGDRVPAVFLRPGTLKLHVCHSVNKEKNTCYNGNTDLSKTEYTHIAINQYRLKNNRYAFSVHRDGKQVYEVINDNAQIFKNVKLYAANPFHDAADASIYGITWLNGHYKTN